MIAIIAGCDEELRLRPILLLGDDRLIAIDPLGRDAGEEEVARHRGERLGDPRIGDDTPGAANPRSGRGAVSRDGRRWRRWS
jgi:hypothetical protein